ncbi:hypothetical protein [Couchioplanes azureus]|uniref:hypothetical protein n=2 Tax=Couchioplanes caeruleus TaxID=56438 RepID=UPI00188D63BA|nr:hypothetical protein [Couchioplanes caeruleus]GGQ67805.1 hypothetical protein GCM10010166_42240 [Couchioplanes caeruleus subsp. azureus]
MGDVREVVWSYGSAFDTAVDRVAKAMAANGHVSRHAPASRSSADASESELRSAVVGLAMLCEGIDNALRGAIQASRSPTVNTVNFLTVYGSAKRLIKLIRMAQQAHQLQGRAAAEVDGDVDNLEELLLRLDEPDEIVEASRSLIIAARPFSAEIPLAIRDGLLELESLL